MVKLHTENEIKALPIDYTEAEAFYVREKQWEMFQARDNREMNHTEFDDMSYTQYYVSNMKADVGYIRPKQNEGDTRLNAGITPEKDNALASMLVNFNFAPNVKPVNSKSGLEIEELGEQMEDLLKKSRLDEPVDYEVNRLLMYQELLRQGDVFVEDLMREKWEVQKDIEGQIDFCNGLNKQWKEKVVLAWRKLGTEIISGLNFYPGNIRTFYMEEQPYIFTSRIVPYSVAESIFRKFPRWKFVQKDLSTFSGNISDTAVTYHNWSIGTLQQNQVEIVQYQNVPKNELAIFVNGVLMTPVKEQNGKISGFPLSYLTRKSRYTIVKGSGSPISRYFFYSKSIPAKTKTDEAMMSEFYRLMILKTQQSFMKPMANRTKQELDQGIFLPGVITSNLNPADIQPLIEANGVTQAEMAVVEFVKRIIDGKSVSPTFQGQAMSGQQTAREIMELQKQSAQKLGTLLLMVIQLEKDLTKLRLDNIMHYWTQLNDPTVNEITNKLIQSGKAFEVESTFEDGTNGKKIIEFDDVKAQRTPKQILAEEKLLEGHGKRVRKVYLSRSALRNIDITWKITIEPTEKDSDALEATMAKENYLFFSQEFPGRLNQDFWLAELAKHAKVDKEQAFIDVAQGMMPGGEQGMQQDTPQQAGGRTTQQLRQAGSPRPQRPTVNTLMNA